MKDSWRLYNLASWALLTHNLFLITLLLWQCVHPATLCNSNHLITVAPLTHPKVIHLLLIQLRVVATWPMVLRAANIISIFTRVTLGLLRQILGLVTQPRAIGL